MAIPIATAKASRPKMIVRMSCRPRSLPLPLTASDVPVPVGAKGEGVGEEEEIVVAGETVPCGQVFMSL
jgi:hypothetical protein